MKEPARLGRGLAALFGDVTPTTDTTGPTASTLLDDLEPNPYQPRANIKDEDLADLVASIREQGVLQPILIRPHPTRAGKFQIIAGERRWRAARLAGLSSIASYTRNLSDDGAAAAALVENLQREDLNPIEEAEGFKRLIDTFGLTQEAMAKAIGKSRSHVANTLRLLHLPPDVIERVREGALTAGHARAALASADPAEAARHMIERGLNVRQAEALTLPRPPAERRKPSGTPLLEQGSADLRAVEADLTAQLGLRVSISFDGQGGTVSLRYQTLDQLDFIVASLGRH